MNDRVASIVDEARKLTLQERQELLERLQLEFNGDAADVTSEEAEAAWIDEVERRMARKDAVFVDAGVVMTELRAKLAKP